MEQPAYTNIYIGTPCAVHKTTTKTPKHKTSPNVSQPQAANPLNTAIYPQLLSSFHFLVLSPTPTTSMNDNPPTPTPTSTPSTEMSSHYSTLPTLELGPTLKRGTRVL